MKNQENHTLNEQETIKKKKCQHQDEGGVRING